MFQTPQPRLPACGCWFRNQNSGARQYLPQLQLDSHTTILATTSKTVLRQTFHNPLRNPLSEVRYTFPLYDGVSVSGFTCSVAGRVIVGIVKEKHQARVDYEDAKSKGQTAGLLEQNPDAADVFTTSIGNVPAGIDVLVEITYLGELKNDAETDGARFTIPTVIAPRYGASSVQTWTGLPASNSQKLDITLDIMLEQGCAIRGIQSPSHPIAVSMGTISTRSMDDSFENNLGSATLALGSTELDKDFVVVISAKGQDTPRALLETHPTIPNQRALMATLVPRFNIPNDNPEIVFVVDRSGSMSGKMDLVIDALKVLLKSLPVGVKFNICSFGSRHSFLFDRSRTYDAASLKIAMEHINPRSFMADYGGTEMQRPVEDLIQRRYTDLPLEVILLTDGEIWNQESLFKTINEASTRNARFFTLGIGSGASSSLVEGIARAGRGFAQWVHDGERIDKRIVRMLKGALSPHIKYKLEVKYAQESTDEDGFEMIESFEKSMKVVTNEITEKSPPAQKVKKISLFNTETEDEPTNPPAGRYDNLPQVSVPNVLQTPHELPELYPHNRTTVYLLLGAETQGRTLEAVILRGSSTHGDLELEIPVQNIGHGETIHKLAAKKATQELEEGRGWLTAKCTTNGKSLKSQNEGNWDLIVEREAVRLGTTFQVAGKFCSFVAIEKNKKDGLPATQNVFGAPPAYEEEDEDGAVECESREQSVHAPGMATSFASMQAMQAFSVQSSSICAERLVESPFAARRAKAAAPAFGFGGSGVNSRSKRGEGQSSSGIFGQSGGGLFGVFGAKPPPPPLRRGAPTSASSNEAIDGGAVMEARSARSSSSIMPAAFKKSPFVSSVMKQAAPSALMGSSFGFGSSQQSPERPVETINMTVLEKMQRLISLQSFEGSWSISEEFLAIISHDAKSKIGKSDVKKLVTKDLMDYSHGVWVDELNDDDCATILAIAWLETVMKDESDVWELVVEKARGSLESHVDGSDRIDVLLDGVRNTWVVAA